MDKLLAQGCTRKIIEDVPRLLTSFYFSEKQKAELFTRVGLARWLRGEHEEARVEFQDILKHVPDNEHAILGLARLNAEDGDYSPVQAFMEQLPDGLTRDILQIICARCPDHVEDTKEEDMVDKIVERWTKTSPEHPFAVAEVFIQAVRFYVAQPEHCADKNFDCNWCLGLLGRARNRLQIGGMNLYRLAAVETLASVLEEKEDPDAALTSAQNALTLWSQQFEPDPTNQHFRREYQSSTERVLALATDVHLQAVGTLTGSPGKIDYLSERVEHAQALVMRTRDVLGDARIP